MVSTHGFLRVRVKESVFVSIAPSSTLPELKVRPMVKSFKRFPSSRSRLSLIWLKVKVWVAGSKVTLPSRSAGMLTWMELAQKAGATLNRGPKE